MQDSSAFQFLAIDTIHESTTNPRRTFEESKLHELAESIRHHGLIQPITVRPNASGFEIVAGARRFRAAQMAEIFAVPARIVDIDDAQAQEWQIIENSLRIDVHPYEEATGYQRLLDLPGYDVATIAERIGKSASHIYARLSLLQLIPAIAEAFTRERITASHANLLARLPQEAQAKAYEQCWRKDWQDTEPHLLPARHLAAWIQANLYLALADAPFNIEDATLNPVAGACTTCPRRSGYNTSLFEDVEGDQCLDSPCYQGKVASHIDREIAATPGLIQIESGYRPAKEKTAGAVQRGHFREIVSTTDNPDAEPVPSCEAAKPAIIVYGRNIGATLTVCTDEDCPVHDPLAEKKRKADEERVQVEAEPVSPEPIEPTEEEKQEQEERRRERERQDEERIGVYKTTDAGGTWNRFGTGLPNVQVTDIQLDSKLGILAAGTYGRGAWEIKLPPATNTTTRNVEGQAGALVTLKADVTPSGSAGSIVFEVNGVAVPGSATYDSATGHAEQPLIINLPAGTYQITADFISSNEALGGNSGGVSTLTVR